MPCAPGAPRGGARAAGGGDQRKSPHGRAATSAPRVAWLSEVCRLAGRGAEAWQYAHQALEVALQHKERAHEAYALHQLGAVQAHADPPDAEQAEAHYQQALALAEALGMRPLRPTATLGWAGCTARSAVVRRPVSPCPPPSTSTVPWT